MPETSFDYGYSTYLPSILLVNDDNASSRQLRQQLEERGCQVHQTNLSPAGLAKVRKNYVELIVLDIELVDIADSKIYRQLGSEPDLRGVPVVILTTYHPAEESIRWLKKGRPVYCLSSKDVSTAARLWQIIEHKHYLANRYM